MDKRQVKILDDFASDLKSFLNLEYLLPHLMKRKLLTTSEEQKLKNLAKTNHDNNSEFLDYLKTKGALAFSLFLAALRDETEHLGHVDLCNRMSKHAEQAGIRLSITFEASPEAMGGGLSAGIGNQLIHHSHSVSEPATRRESLDSSVGSPSRSLSTSFSATAKIIGESFTERIEKTQNSILQQLDKIEKVVNENREENRKELEKLKKLCAGQNLLIQKLIHPWPPRPNRHQGSRPGSSGMEADYSSDGSEASERNSRQTGGRKTKKLTQRSTTWPALISQSDSSLHSTQEDVASSTVGDHGVLAVSTTEAQTLPPVMLKKPLRDM